MVEIINYIAVTCSVCSHECVEGEPRKKPFVFARNNGKSTVEYLLLQINAPQQHKLQNLQTIYVTFFLTLKPLFATTALTRSPIRF